MAKNLLIVLSIVVLGLSLASAQTASDRKEAIALVEKDGSGWVDYFYRNPKTGKEEDKTTYLKRVDDLVICCGIYR